MMIDKRYQGKGYGEEAIINAIEFVRTSPHGNARVIELTYKPENVVAKKIYASLGFVETGNKLACGEVPAELVL